MLLKDQVAIVTGAGSGLGRTHALFLAKQGAKVMVNDAAGMAVAQAVADEIVAMGGMALAHAASVTDEAAVQAMVAQTVAHWRHVDILINNAGILRDRSFAKMGIDEFRQVLDVHLIGSFIATKAVWDIMRDRSYGRIVMTTSSSGLFGNFGQANYGAAKMALVGLMQTLALEGAKHDIRVNCLAPTAATQMTKELLPADMLALLRPELVSPVLLKLAGKDAPTRTILCAGAGHFAAAHITLGQGAQIGDRPDVAERIVEQWDAICDRTDDIVPASGMVQSERELQAAGAAAAIP